MMIVFPLMADAQPSEAQAKLEPRSNTFLCPIARRSRQQQQHARPACQHRRSEVQGTKDEQGAMRGSQL